MNPPQGARSGLIAWFGVVWGLSAALALAAIRVMGDLTQGDPHPFPADAIAGLALLAPFGLALLALLRDDPAQRAASWLAAAAISALVAVSVFSGAGLLMLPAGLLLTLAAIRTLRGGGRTGLSLALAGLLAVLFAASLGALFLHQDGVCWQRIRAEDGRLTWQDAPYSQTGTVMAGNASGPGVAEERCASDTFAPDELAISMALAALGIGAWWLAPRALRREPSA